MGHTITIYVRDAKKKEQLKRNETEIVKEEKIRENRLIKSRPLAFICKDFYLDFVHFFYYYYLWLHRHTDLSYKVCLFQRE